ncbi:extracellular glycosidase [Exophiala dermatitidis]
MHYPFKTSVFLLLSLPLFLSTTLAQTFTSCNPMNRTDCPADTALGVANYTIDFRSSIMSDRVWNTTAGKIDYQDDGADFTINRRGDVPTVQTNFYIFFGQVEVIMKAAKGQGIVSSIVLESDLLDEVDWEWIGGNNTHVQSNYFGKGNHTSYDRAVWHPVDNAQDDWHNYTVDWTNEQLEWFIDGKSVRVLKYADANGGSNFPQTPSRLILGAWAGGDPTSNSNGTVEWAGGEVNYDNGPYTMTVQSVRVTDASRGGSQYVYGDKTGSWQSIKVLNETKPIKLDGENSDSTTQSAKQKWNGLSSTTKYIIVGVVCGVALLCIAIFAFCCIRQRRAGKHEKLIEDAKYDKNAVEVLAYRADMTRLRNEKMSDAQVHVSPVMGNAGAMYQNAGQTQPMMGGMSPNPNPQYNNYAQSPSSFGPGRGYQRY